MAGRAQRLMGILWHAMGIFDRNSKWTIPQSTPQSIRIGCSPSCGLYIPLGEGPSGHGI
jgi:hypothetical protein